MRVEEIKKFWESQAQKYDTAPQASTKDYFMRQLEIRFLENSINQLLKTQRINKIADIGCGNGYSLIALAKHFPDIEFVGCDYSEGMISCANKCLADSSLSNLDFCVFDITKEHLTDNFDLIYTDRCLINLPSWELQKSAIKKICDGLCADGVYIMIENFMDGHNNFNKLRRDFGLDEIKIHEFSLYFDRDMLEDFVGDFFEILDFSNISSMYYIVSRIIYTKLCTLENKEPDYFDKHHELASLLPFAGNYGPTAMYYLKKK
jgi:ubiquinone/menaquinone biosynthesis C-methylase UbiE